MTAYDAVARPSKPLTIKDSTWLSSESVMTSKIDQARGTVPLGSIVAYPNFGNLSAYVSDDYVECDGRAIPANTDIRKKMGITRTPNLYKGMGTSGQGYFLRAGSTPMVASADKFESHLHGQPEHMHYVDGGLTSTTVSGTAKGQEYIDNKGGGIRAANMDHYWSKSAEVDAKGYERYYFNENIWKLPTTIRTDYAGGSDWEHNHSHSHAITNFDAQAWRNYPLLWNEPTTQQAKDSSVTGDVDIRFTKGEAHNSGGDDTYQTGEDETAPTYYTTRYFMRVNE